MKTNKNIALKRNLKGFTLVELLVVIAIIASLAGLSYGPIMRHLDSSARTEAISNGKQIYTALSGFMAANEGAFPNDSLCARASVTTDGTAVPYFSLLFKGGSIGDDKYFNHKQGVRVGIAARLSDNNGILETDENCWGYVAGMNASDDTFPLLYDSSNDGLAYLTNTWKGKAIIIKADGGAKAHNITLAGPLDPNDPAQNGPVEELVGTTPTGIMAGVVANAATFTLATP